MTIKADIVNHVSKICKVPVNEISEDMQIFSSKIISSLGLLELMLYIEQKFHIVINSEDLIEKNFKDINILCSFVESKLNFNRK